MSQERLNHVTVLHVHKERLDTVNTDKLTAEFVSRNDYRRSVFGQITCEVVSTSNIHIRLGTIVLAVMLTML